MIKLKNILREGYAWERKADGSLPTLADTSAAYAANMQEQVDDDAAEIKSYIKAITKLVAEVNELIGRAIDSDGDPLEITDPSSTWPSGKYYEPVTFENNVLTIKGHDVYSNKPEVDTYDINQAIQDPDSNYWQLTDSVDSLKYMRRKLKHAILRNSRKAPDIEEAAKPDYIDADGDGNETESMKKAFKDKEAKNESAFVTKGGLQEMRELPLEQKILRNFKGTNFILSETFKK